MNTTRKELRELTDDIMDYIFEKMQERIKEIKIDIDKKLDKQKDDILVAVNKIMERLSS